MLFRSIERTSQVLPRRSRCLPADVRFGAGLTELIRTTAALDSDRQSITCVNYDFEFADLDFNYVGFVDLGRMTEDQPETISRLESIARRAGYRVQFSRAQHAGQKPYLCYRSALGGEELSKWT